MKEVSDGKQGNKQGQSGEKAPAIQSGIQARGGAVAGIRAEAGDTAGIGIGRGPTGSTNGRRNARPTAEVNRGQTTVF